MLLIIENDPAQSAVWTQLCKQFDYTAHISPDTKNALIAVSLAQYAALIIDIDFVPVSEITVGFIEELRTVERQHNRRKLPILVAHTPSDSVNTNLEHVDVILQKPFEPEEFRRLLLRWAYQPDKPNLKILPKSNHS
jgi:CheY-like chemotaxis protein